MIFVHTLPLANRRQLPSAMAVYAVFDGDALLYVGATGSLKRRFTQHFSAGKFDESHIVKWNEFEECEIEKFKAAEVDLISLFKPKLNRRVQGPSTVLKKWKNWAAPDTGMRKARESSKIHQLMFDMLNERISKSTSKVRTLDKIAKESKLTYSWLDMFVRDCGGSPSVLKLEILYKYLTGSEIEIANPVK